jgi:UDP-N-acetylmuramoylalanine--D-glutamate ligase
LSEGKTALLLGLGRFGGGQEAAAFLLRQGWRVRIADKATRESLGKAVAALEGGPHGDRIEWCLGREDEALADGADLLVCNPAIPDTHPLLLLARERGLPVSQEVELFLESYPGRVVLVTGTNGKSTTTTLLGGALAAAGADAIVGGNLGKSLLGSVAEWRRDQTAVLEISSFQLARLDRGRHRVHGSVLVRVTRDHIDRHGTLDAYWQAKSVAAEIATEFVVHCADDPVASRFDSPARRRVRYSRVAGVAADLCVRDGWLVSTLEGARCELLHAEALALLGDFHVENALAALGAALLLGASPHRSALAVCRQPPLPYRLQLWVEHAGKKIYDNGVSTEVESTESAVRALRGPVHWIGGGKSKDGDFARVAQALRGRIASAHLFGAAAEHLAPLLRDHVRVTVSTRATEALHAAWSLAAAGDNILFSPAFASFDQYPNYQARAEEFRAAAAELARTEPTAHDVARVAEGS